jgi:hypothetical protein
VASSVSNKVVCRDIDNAPVVNLGRRVQLAQPSRCEPIVFVEIGRLIHDVAITAVIAFPIVFPQF